MDRYWQTKQGQLVILIVILIGSEILLLANLGNQYLWQDEAQTALISKTILTDGVPRGYDGKNSFSQEGGADMQQELYLAMAYVAAFLRSGGVLRGIRGKHVCFAAAIRVVWHGHSCAAVFFR